MNRHVNGDTKRRALLTRLRKLLYLADELRDMNEAEAASIIDTLINTIRADHHVTEDELFPGNDHESDEI